MEVLVDHIDANPDRPITIVGVVYNASNMPPWALPASATQTPVGERYCPSPTPSTTPWTNPSNARRTCL